MGEILLKSGILDKLMIITAFAVFLSLCFLLPAKYPDMFIGTGKKIEVTITTGMSAREAAEAVRDAGVVGSAGKLAKWMVNYGIDRTLKPGVYELSRAGEAAVAKQLAAAKPKTHAVTLIPGARYRSALRAVTKSDEGGAEFDTELADDGNFPAAIREILPDAARDRIIFLLPETYFLAPGKDVAKQFVRRASSLWYERVGAGLPQDIDKKSLFAAGILASLVEGEAKVPEERPILAGIFLSRIEKHMRLQSCATVIYCWETVRGEHKTHLTYKDLEIDSPYNTYLNDGLPPGPISVPSEDSWKAAISPQETDYLYFFATDEGSHVFSKTYKEHINKQNKAAPQ